MEERYKRFLLNFYKQFKESGIREFQHNFCPDDPDRKYKIKDFYNIANYLIDCGYVECTVQNAGSCVLKLTPKGIDLCGNNFSIPSQPSVVGNNNIIVSGSSNYISNYYNQVISDVRQAEIPNETKELIIELIEVMQNQSTAPIEKQEKLKSFVKTILEGTVTSTAASGLYTLLSAFFHI